MKKRVSTTIALTLASVLALSACTGGNNNNGQATTPSATNASGSATEAPKDVNLRIIWWGNQDRHDITSQVLDLYSASKPNITFSPEYQGFDGYYQKLTLLAASNNMPDIFQFYVGASEANQFTNKGLVEPLDEYIANGLIDVSNIGESTLSGGKDKDGKIYGIPLGVNARAMFVDVAAYEKAGLTIPENGYDTWEAVYEDLKVLKGVTGSYGADDILNSAFTFHYYARQFGQSAYAEGTGIGFDEKVFTDFFNMRKQWVSEGLMPKMDATLSVKGPEESFFVKGQSAVLVGYTNQYPSIAKAAGRDIRMIMLPGPNSDKAMDVRPGLHFSISSKSENKEEAAQFISYFVNNVEANMILNANRGMPISSTVREALSASFEPEMKAVAEYMEKVAGHSGPLDPPVPAGTGEIQALMEDIEQQIMFDQISPADGYAKLAKEAASITADYKE
ncbi:extracellular solute-binding protein [Paenibacillus sp. HB172176]|uniref:ABC transporter substrate-binding protein n=1 Tax=Paenibacillus sp. HB172176 TaxID=2493690 RepID=UPI00143C7274|nr:extracellular solute-binding protein [Paenibacillus sp. HB172176]